MKGSISIPVRWAVAVPIAVALCVQGIGPAMSADTVWSGSAAGRAGPQAAAAYYLQGDTTNSGAGVTNFDTTANGNPWHFSSTGSSATTVYASCPNGTSCWGVQGIGTGIGVYGTANNASAGGNTAAGVQGTGNSTAASGTSYGGYFSASNSASGGKAYGVYGSAANVGVYANSSSGNGVYAKSTYANGNGVYATGSGSNFYGVWGDVGGGGYGIVGSSSGGIGAYGSTSGSTTSATDVAGAYGYSGLSAVGATSARNAGVFGTCAHCIGVSGKSTDYDGVRGTSTSRYGVYGKSASNNGVYATTTTGTAALRAVNPNKTSNHYAGLFDGNVRINGNYVATGTKSAVVATTEGDRLMYAEEATQNYFSDQGMATLKHGRVVVKLDPLFAQTVDLSKPYMVIVTPLSFDTAGLGAGNLTASSFEVRELNRGKGSFAFSWRVTALRKGYADARMDAAPANVAPTDADRAGALPAEDPSMAPPTLKAPPAVGVPSPPQMK